jgi:fucose 4-O-acetylase-like acetyltransferase
MNITTHEYLDFYGNITAPIPGAYIKFQKVTYEFALEKFAFMIVTNEVIAMYLNKEPFAVIDSEVQSKVFKITTLVQNAAKIFTGYNVTSSTQAEVIQCSNVNSDQDNYAFNFMTVNLWEASDLNQTQAKTYLTRAETKITANIGNITIELMSSLAVEKIRWVSQEDSQGSSTGFIAKESLYLTMESCQET